MMKTEGLLCTRRVFTRGFDRLYRRFIRAVYERGGVCVPAGELAEEAGAWLP